MRRQTIWIVIGVAAAAIVLLCAVVGGVGYYLARQQERQVADVFATISAGLEQATIEPEPTPTSAAATPSPANPIRQPEATGTAQAERTTSAAAEDPIDPSLPSGADVAAALVDASKAELSKRSNLTRYRISATLEPQQDTITGAQIVELTNTEDTVLNEVYFRLYVNAPHYNEGEITVTDVEVDGDPASADLELGDTALKVALPQPLQPGQSVAIGMRFTTIVPDSGGGYGIFNEANGVYALYNWHPEVAVYEKEGWLLNPVSDQGDPTNTDVANYEVTFAAPENFTVITSGVEVGQEQQANHTAHTSVAALTRNFVVVATDKFESATQTVGSVEVTSYYLPASAEGGKATLQTAAKSIEIFSQAFGPYPYKELDVAQIELGGGAAGMEATGLILIGSEYYDPKTAAPLAGLGSVIEGVEGANVLTFTTAHEVAHQWWYSVVGSDAYKQPWLDESLTNWSSAFYVDEVAGENAGKLARDLFIGVPYRSVLQAGDRRLDQQVEAFSDEEYGAIVYGKGALVYDVLRQELGDDTFFAFLRQYYQEQQFDRADGGEWLQTLNQVADKDMTPFYQKWIEGSAIQETDLPPGGPLSEFFSGRFDDLLRPPGTN